MKADADGSDRMQTDKLLYRDLTYKIIGLLFKVHTQLGCGFPEKIYQQALISEFCKEKVPFEIDKEIKVVYDRKQLDILN